MTSYHPNIFTIPLSSSFLDTLSKSILKGLVIRDWSYLYPIYSLSTATIYLPTKRSADQLATCLKTHSQTNSLLLPRIISLGEIDDNNTIFFSDNDIENILSDSGLAPSVSPLKRRLILTKFILAWSQKIETTLTSYDIGYDISIFQKSVINEVKSNFSVAKTIEDSLALADALGYLIDTLTIHKKTWKDVHDLLPQDLSDQYWRISKDFLQIAAETWPAYCKLEGVMDAAERRDLTISREAERLLKNPPKTPIIIAGSTGSMPSTARLICSISKLPCGIVVLPGLDKYLDHESWIKLVDNKNKIVNPNHPQALLSKLINEIGISRDDVVSLTDHKNTYLYRDLFLSECMRPYDTTHLWANKTHRIEITEIVKGLEAISLVEAENERVEALAISLILRSSLEVAGKTAALITPDRSLAKRVIADLMRWGIMIEDSAGIPLHKTPLGSITILLAKAIIDRFSPVSTLTLLNHADIRLGLAPDILKRGISAIDIGLSRISTSGRNIDDLISSLLLLREKQNCYRMPFPNRRLTIKDWDCATIILNKLQTIYNTFRNLDDIDITTFFKNLSYTLEKILASPTDTNRISNLIGYEQLLKIFNTIYLANNLDLNIAINSYASFFEQLMASEMIPNHFSSHPRIMILGLIEARLLHFDLVILGSLNENVWPPEGRTDPFLNRPWRHELGLPVPERRIGQTAHDFVSALGAEQIFLTRALKHEGSPTIPSRFIQRMRATAGSEVFNDVLKRGQVFLNLVYKLDEEKASATSKQPQPIPPKSLLPNKLSVTEIETLRRDPYSIYAKHVLKLDYLEKIGHQIDRSERGNIYHLILSRFSERWPVDLPQDSLDQFLSISRDVLSSIVSDPVHEAVWWPRIKETGRWYVQWEQRRRRLLVTPVTIERHGSLTIELPRGGEFTLSGQADRIEILEDGEFNIIDYKTGKIPSQQQVQAGFSSQLTLAAAMLKRGAFYGLSGKRPHELVYVKVGIKEGGQENPIKNSDDLLQYDDIAESHFLEFIKLVDDHWNGSRPFYSRPYLQFITDFSKYDHLARFWEWSVIVDDSDDVYAE